MDLTSIGNRSETKLTFWEMLYFTYLKKISFSKFFLLTLNILEILFFFTLSISSSIQHAFRFALI